METSVPTLGGQGLVLTNLSPSPAQRRLALGIALVLLVVFIGAAPFATLPMPRINAFVPAYATAILVNDAITAALLFAQFSIVLSGSRSAPANGSFMPRLVVVPWAVAFAIALTQGGLLAAGIHSTAGLIACWQVGFPLFAIAYARLRDAHSVRRFSQGVIRATLLA